MSQPQRQRSYLRRLNGLGRSLSLAAYVNGQDHALLLADSFDEPANNIRIWSYLTLARGALEAWVRAASLIDRGTDPEQRLLVQCAALIEGEANQRTLARELDNTLLPQLERLRDQDEKRFTRAGIELVRDKQSKVVAVKRGGRRAPVSLNVSDEARRRLNYLPSAYRVGSAAMHSGAWFLAAAMGDGKSLSPAADPDLIVAATAIVLEAHVALWTSIAPDDESAEKARQFAVEHLARILFAKERDHGPS